MPGGSRQASNGVTSNGSHSDSSSRPPVGSKNVGTQKRQADAPVAGALASSATNDHPQVPAPSDTTNQRVEQLNLVGSSHAAPLTVSLGSTDAQQNISQLSTNVSSKLNGDGHLSAAKPARDLNALIDLMPPLSIEHGTKRLILAKKLDRESLDKYIAVGGYQGPSAASQSLSSASLTVHIKCQLKVKKTSEQASNETINSHLDRRISKSFNTHSIIIPIHLIVTDENDNRPVFINSPYIVEMNETTQAGSLLIGDEIVAVDGDQQGPFSTVEYRLVPGNYWSDSFAFLNPLDSRSLVVKNTKLLDYESNPKIVLKIMAHDQGEPPSWSITSLHVNILDNDDMNPIFMDDKYLGYLKENRPGESIELIPRRLFARDGDSAINTPINYSFHVRTNHSMHFELDPETGRLSLKKRLPDHLSSVKQPFCLLVRATQVDNPRRWTISMVNILMTRAFDSYSTQSFLTLGVSPEKLIESNTGGRGLKFEQSNYTVELSESLTPGSFIFTFRATYKSDTSSSVTNGDGIKYQLLDNEFSYFSIDDQTGKLTLNRSLDYEMHRNLSVRILATLEYSQDKSMELINPESTTNSHSDFPLLACDLARVTIHVLNSNEFSPEFSHEQYNFQLQMSDLIASFESEKSETGFQEEPVTSSGLAMRRISDGHPVRRLGDSRGDDFGDEEQLGEDREIYLGQIFCGDRDLGDKLTFQLVGSKASLFRLAKDGRLYLPLVNISSTSNFAEKRSDQSSHSQSSRATNNQFFRNKVFASRRSDQFSQEPLDRNFLNHLLSEFSNLAKIRLKVIASDDGKPEIRQSSALIILSIIRVDNFILQKASPEASLEHNEPLANQNISNLGIKGSETPGVKSSQVMMIPAANGRSFVQINAEIMKDLISSPQHDDRNMSASNEIVAESGLIATNVSRPAINYVNLQAIASESTMNSNTNVKFHHPPSLLLIDEDGAKLLAMPAAIEVYSKQVQEASDMQQARQKVLLLNNSTQNSQLDTSIWNQFKSYFDFSRDSSNKPKVSALNYWLNLSASLAVHLIVILIILVLVSRFRASSSENSFGSCIFQSRFMRFSFPNSKYRHQRSVTSILNQASGSYATRRPCVASSESSESSSYAFPGQQSNKSLRENLNRCNENLGFEASKSCEYLEESNFEINLVGNQQIASNQAVLSAKTTQRLDNMKVPQNHQDLKSKNEIEHHHLFGQLKQTLNKILVQNEQSPCIGDITVKTQDFDATQQFDICIDSSEFASENSPQMFRIDSNRYNNKTTTPQTVEKSYQQSPTKSSRSIESVRKSSTFLGSSAAPMTAPSQTESSKNEGHYGSTTVVSINVPVPKTQKRLPPAKPSVDKKTKGSSVGETDSSSGSSVVSLASSSSLSNKISTSLNFTSNRNNSSDVSSLDSNNLFKDFSSIPVTRSEPSSLFKPPDSPRNKIPPPPPPPPPPSLVQLGIAMAERQAAQRTAVIPHQQQTASKPFSSRPRIDTEKLPPLTKGSARRLLPENPVHLRLRQQAVGGIQEQNRSTLNEFSKQSQLRPSSSNNSFKHNKDSLSPRQSDYSRPHTSQQTPDGATLSVKTVSPTTSDKGYESLQSYTTSPGQKYQVHPLDRNPRSLPVSNDLIEPEIGKRNYRLKTINLRSDRLQPIEASDSLPILPPPPPLPIPSSRPLMRDTRRDYHHQSVVPIATSQLDLSVGQSSLLVSGHPTTKSKPTRPPQDFRGASSSFSNLSKDQIYKEASSTRRSTATRQQNPRSTSNLSTKSIRERAIQASPSVAAPVATTSAVSRPTSNHFLSGRQVNDYGDTEDDDFYYGPNQLDRLHEIQVKDCDKDILSEYASHTYVPHAQPPITGRRGGAENYDKALPAPVGAATMSEPHSYRSETSNAEAQVGNLTPVQGRSSSNMSSRGVGGSLMRDHKLVASREVRRSRATSGAQAHSPSRHQARHHHSSSNLATSSTNGKKQLTWSDQVSIT